MTATQDASNHAKAAPASDIGDVVKKGSKDWGGSNIVGNAIKAILSPFTVFYNTIDAYAKPVFAYAGDGNYSGGKAQKTDSK